jgi:epoxyqueuosine reductase
LCADGVTIQPDTEWLKEQARTLGFDVCGVVAAAAFPELGHFEDWLGRGFQGEMKYLEDPRRRNPSLVLTPLRSIIVCALNYNTQHPYSTEVANKSKPAHLTAKGAAPDEKGEKREDFTIASRGGVDDGKAGAGLPLSKVEPRGWISRYAWGDDYHEVMWSRLNALEESLKKRFAEPFESRALADTGPVAERVLAKYAGLGWLGKNTLLLNKEIGSWMFLGVILTSLELAPSLVAGEPWPRDLCGSCRKCIEACPTDALVEPYVLDARRCISYLTIELRGSIPEEFREPMGWQVYGCDICQDVCPYNRKAPVAQMQEFQPRAAGPEGSLLMPKLEWLAGLTPEEFRGFFRGSAMKRTKWQGLVRNACIALGNAGLMRTDPGHHGAITVLERLAKSTDSVIAGSAEWAIERIR